MYRFKLKQPDTEWLGRLNDNGFTRDFPFATRKTGYGYPVNLHLDILKLKLLDDCGIAVCLPAIEEHLHPILNRGTFRVGTKALMRLGEPCHCHLNSARLWEPERARFTICTGYAMSRDGIWRQHSWCIEYLGTERERIIETTEKRLLYFGFELTEQEADQFFYENGY